MTRSIRTPLEPDHEHAEVSKKHGCFGSLAVAIGKDDTGHKVSVALDLPTYTRPDEQHTVITATAWARDGEGPHGYLRAVRLGTILALEAALKELRAAETRDFLRRIGRTS